MARWDAIQPGAIICQLMQELTPQDMFDSCGKPNEEEDKGSHAAIFKVKFGQKAEESSTDSRERNADTLFSYLEYVAEVLEENNTKSNFIPTACCLRDTRERETIGNQVKSAKDTLLCMPFSS